MTTMSPAYTFADGVSLPYIREDVCAQLVEVIQDPDRGGGRAATASTTLTPSLPPTLGWEKEVFITSLLPPQTAEGWEMLTVLSLPSHLRQRHM